MRNYQYLKVKNSLLELKNDFIDVKDIELKDREIKTKKEIEELFIKPIIASIEDMDRFEEEEMKKTRPIKNTCYDWLINHILKSIRKSVSVSGIIIALNTKVMVIKTTTYH